MNQLIFQIDGIAGVMPALETLGREITRLRGSERVSAGEVQSLASDLTRIRLLLNELERKDVCENGASKEAAVRCLELEGMIRVLRSDLDQIMMRVSA